jgi:hypothetical protein
MNLRIPLRHLLNRHNDFHITPHLHGLLTIAHY